jgi:membrane-bound lytic murein transglycosylase D
MKKLFPLIFWATYAMSFAQDEPSISLNNDTNSTSETTSLAYAEETDTQLMVNLNNSILNKKSVKKTINEEFTSDILKQRLENLNHTTPFNVEYNATIERFIRLYLKTRKDGISNLMDKAKYYFPIFEERLDKYNLPLEIKYLAIVESALEPNSKSHMGAKGLWQFMYNTGKQYGLNITSYVDERSDPIKATEAACKYLESLYTRFNDWDLALAAYNSGPGNVSKAIRRSGGLRNYWNIRQYLPAETRGYIPAFYATFYLFEYGAEHDIYPKNSSITFFETDTIHVKKKITFTQIKKEIDITIDLLRKLNPQYKLGIIPANGNHYVLTLPENLIGEFVSNEHKIYNLPELNKREASNYIVPTTINSYVVQQGDNLSRISKKFNLPLHQLKKWNGLQTNYIISGQSIVITSKNNTPTKNRSQKNSNLNIKGKESSVLSGQVFKLYKVKEGDSLFLISKKFPEVSISQIRNWNNLWEKSHLKPGTQLKILTNTK